MNILAVSQQFPPSVGGTETNIFNLYKTMSNLGHNVTVVTTLWNTPPNTKLNEVLNGIEVYRVKKILGMSMKIKSLASNFDIIHVHSYTGLLASIPPKTLTGLPIVMEPHGYDIICLNGNLYLNGTPCKYPMTKHCLKCTNSPFFRSCISLSLRRLVLPKIDYWVAVSDYMANTISSVYKNPKSKIQRIYNGVDHKKFQDVPKVIARNFLVDEGYVQENDIVVSITSRMEEKKGQRLVMKSIPHILEKNGNVKFIFVGHGDDFEHLVSLSKRREIIKNTVFTGKVEWGRIAYFYRGADIFIIPSLWPEVFGNATLEAMASGLPIIGTNRGATPELINDSKNGYIIEPMVETLVEKLNILIEDEELRKKMGNESIILSKNYSWEKSAKEMIKLFEDCVCSKESKKS